jgi:hypothetical protein
MNMTEEKKIESVNAGNSDNFISKDGPTANEIAGGKPNESTSQEKVNLEDYVPKKQYDEATSKVSEQGSELGALREFVKEVSPLIEKMRENPALVEAIMNDKIDLELAQAVMDGKVTIKEATEVAEAHKEVKKELGEKEYSKTSEKDIEKLISDKLKDVDSKIDKKFNEVNVKFEGKKLEEDTAEFIKNTPDYLEYAEQIADYLKENGKWDVSEAYYIVKGKALTEKAVKENDKNASEAAKDIAANAGGGSSQGGKISGRDLVDDLIAGGRNPNYL